MSNYVFALLGWIIGKYKFYRHRSFYILMLIIRNVGKYVILVLAPPTRSNWPKRCIGLNRTDLGLKRLREIRIRSLGAFNFAIPVLLSPYPRNINAVCFPFMNTILAYKQCWFMMNILKKQMCIVPTSSPCNGYEAWTQFISLCNYLHDTNTEQC